MAARYIRLAIVASVMAIGLPLAADADETDRLLRGIVNGIIDEYLPEQDRDRYRDDRRYRGADIPPGHYPPPGTCRVWYPDRPPGHQPPPTSCNVRVPRGAFLVRG